jgi:hypothetical protein
MFLNFAANDHQLCDGLDFHGSSADTKADKFIGVENKH